MNQFYTPCKCVCLSLIIQVENYNNYLDQIIIIILIYTIMSANCKLKLKSIKKDISNNCVFKIKFINIIINLTNDFCLSFY